MIGRICSILRKKEPVGEDKGLLDGSGHDVPEDGSKEWQRGAFFQKTRGADGSALFVNLGNVESSMFRQVLLYDPE
jgi:hypothetical protein